MAAPEAAMDKLAIYMQAEKLRLHGDTEAALPLYRQLLNDDPNDWKVRESMAEALEDRGDRRGALRELFQAAHRLIWQQSYDEATRLLRRMLRIDPEKTFDVTRSVEAALDRIAPLMASAEPTTEAIEDTGQILAALVESEATSGFRVPEEILALLDRVPIAKAPSRTLVIEVEGAPVRISNREFRIGSGDDCQLVFKHRAVAFCHARILELDGRYFLMDADGRTRVNGVEADSPELGDGDRLTFGEGGPVVVVRVG